MGKPLNSQCLKFYLLFPCGSLFLWHVRHYFKTIRRRKKQRWKREKKKSSHCPCILVSKLWSFFPMKEIIFLALHFSELRLFNILVLYGGSVQISPTSCLSFLNWCENTSTELTRSINNSSACKLNVNSGM